MSNINEQILLRLWGKTNREEKKHNSAAPHRYHPLLFHLLDVALCAGQLWDRLPVTLRQRIADALQLSLERTRYAIMLLAGLHDLGKACPPFQYQTESFIQQVKQTGLPLPPDSKNKPHGMISAKEIARMLRDSHSALRWNSDVDAANILAAITGGHHGIFPTSEELNSISPQTLGNDIGKGDLRWQMAREYLAQRLQELLPGHIADEPLKTVAISDRALVPLLAGLISVADWFGSSSHFKIAAIQNALPKVTAAQYASLAERTALNALDQAGWKLPPISPVTADFESVFAYLNPEKPIRANSVQRAVGAQVRDVREPYLLIVESAMGSGKTEAGLYAMDCALANELSHGFYVALPTQATSNAMHARIKKYFEQGGDLSKTEHKGRIKGRINLLLVHANAGLDDNYQNLIVDVDKPIYDGESESEEDAARVIAQRWFTQQKKQALLAPFGVGTIDQALLSVLQTRHWFVRLFGLGGKVVCFDEVHAYDTYMSEILQRLLTWLAEMRCPVILLSATLPASKRLELVEAYAKGITGSKGAKERLLAREQELEAKQKPVGYPRLTFVNGERVEPISVLEESQTKPVELQFASPDASSILASLRRNLPEGGCVAVICNTVDRAQEVYEALRDALKPEGWRVTLFHARTPFLWRQERERVTLTTFGKESGMKGTRLRPKRVLVATQVVEQSLDLDFDLMLSDMAPIDLLLQRMGRLHRHKRVRVAEDLDNITADGFKSLLPARFVVLTDGVLTTTTSESANEGEVTTAYPFPDGPPPAFENAFIYDRYVLLRSWLAIRLKRSIILPTEIQPLVTEVYDQNEPVPIGESSALWLSELKKQKIKMATRDENQEAIAALGLIPEPISGRLLLRKLSRDLKDSDDPSQHPSIRATTRDPTSLSLQVLCIGTDFKGEPLAAMTLAEVDKQPPKQLLKYALSISSKRLFYALLAEKVPASWQQNSYLRYHRPLEFNNGINLTHGLFLSHELGLVTKGGECDTTIQPAE